MEREKSQDHEKNGSRDRVTVVTSLLFTNTIWMRLCCSKMCELRHMSNLFISCL
jgi:hypothetical protein